MKQLCMSAISCNLKIDLEPDPLGVGGIFLYGGIHNEAAVPRYDNGFCSIPVFHGEKNDLKLHETADMHVSCACQLLHATLKLT